MGNELSIIRPSSKHLAMLHCDPAIPGLSQLLGEILVAMAGVSASPVPVREKPDVVNIWDRFVC